MMEGETYSSLSLSFSLSVCLFAAISVTSYWNKKSPQIFTKLPKQLSLQFLLKMLCFPEHPLKGTKFLGYFCKKIVVKNFQKSPTLVTLAAIKLEFAHSGMNLNPNHFEWAFQFTLSYFWSC